MEESPRREPPPLPEWWIAQIEADHRRLAQEDRQYLILAGSVIRLFLVAFTWMVLPRILLGLPDALRIAAKVAYEGIWLAGLDAWRQVLGL